MRMVASSVILGLLLSFNISFAHPTLKDIDGHVFADKSLKGKWVVVNVWASWCTPCINEIKELNHFYQNKKNKVALFAVNYDDLSTEEIRTLSQTYHIHYPSLTRQSVKALKLGFVQAVPATFIFNPEGTLTDIAYGGQTQKSLTNLLINHSP